MKRRMIARAALAAAVFSSLFAALYLWRLSGPLCRLMQYVSKRGVTLLLPGDREVVVLTALLAALYRAAAPLGVVLAAACVGRARQAATALAASLAPRLLEVGLLWILLVLRPGLLSRLYLPVAVALQGVEVVATIYAYYVAYLRGLYRVVAGLGLAASASFIAFLVEAAASRLLPGTPMGMLGGGCMEVTLASFAAGALFAASLAAALAYMSGRVLA